MENVEEVIHELRCKNFGATAQRRDYKDSFVVNFCIENFCDNPIKALLTESLDARDREKKKISKTINFRENVYTRVSEISRLLHCTDGEVVRRILYYQLEKMHKNEENAESEEANVNNPPTNELDVELLYARVVLLEAQLSRASKTLESIKECFEGKKSSESTKQ